MKIFSFVSSKPIGPILLFYVLFSGTSVFAAPIQPFNLIYDVKAGDKSLGSLEVSLEVDGNFHTLTAITKPGKMAKMLGSGESSEVVTFNSTGNGWTLKGFQQVRRGRKAGETTVAKVGNRYEISQNGAGLYGIPVQTAVEPTTIPIAPLTTPSDQLDGLDVMVIRRKGFRAHRYEYSGKETLNINGNSYQTKKFKRVEAKKKDRWYHIWLDQNSNHIIKMERNKDGKRSSIILMP